MQPTQNLVTEPVITPADTLRGAALYLIRHGWHQRDLFDLTNPEVAFPPACGLGGIRMATIGRAEVTADLVTDEAVANFDQAVMAFADHLFTDYGQPDPTASAGADDMPWPEQIVADWNDAYDRNVSQVVAALQGAAYQWDNRHGRLACCGQPQPDETPTSACSRCQYLHGDTEPCWFDACTNCGGPYTFGPSTSDLCGTCAHATGFDGGAA
ncbi:hypothetical protein RB614_37525 [Phytohabitans sp. ZYX-F-186]|uniref:Uncharacterized protein n=1 Tax=Phytohabitans maris TaxID=3071409 RepID=A0ABU0ZT95_9ACTN|nr:hypothetical protein [Phytohabitans sp. ZYX-F-186]MDQ7910212.1 hypothetical protein [Phytohabitans sp. ZYX-F-186]